MALVALEPLLPPETIFDLRYATPNNITGRILYEHPLARLEETAAQHLAEAALKIVEFELRPVIFDAHRPEVAHKQLLAVNSDPRYVLEDSNHPKGLAIDLTLARPDGRYVDMGTDFDDFTERAHSDYPGLNKVQKNNRLFLKTLMAQHGFMQWPYEWWHFDFSTRDTE